MKDTIKVTMISVCACCCGVVRVRRENAQKMKKKKKNYLPYPNHGHLDFSCVLRAIGLVTKTSVRKDLHGDLRSSSKTREGRRSFNAVHSKDE